MNGDDDFGDEETTSPKATKKVTPKSSRAKPVHQDDDEDEDDTDY